MKKISNYSKFLLILKIATVTIFLGRAWQFLFWDAPYRALLWDESLMPSFVQLVFSMSWQEWVSSSTVDSMIQLSIRLTGFLFLVCASLVFFIAKKRLWVQIPLWIGIFFLLLLFVLQTKEKFYHFGQFFEHASQLGTPIILLIFVNEWLREHQLIFWIKVCVGLTFFFHGFYAINYYPRPGVFVDLLLNTLPVSEPFAHQFIWLVGLIDLAILPMLFVPKLVKIALWYAMIWGLLTSFSRITAGFYWDFPLDSLHQVVYTAVYRFSHGLLPLSLMVLYGYKINFSFQKKKDYELTQS